MCYFITVVIPKGVCLPDARAAAERHGRTLEPIHNPGVQQQLHTGEVLCLTTAGHCDCGTALGAKARSPDRSSNEAHSKSRKLAARGWSAAKIERALRDSRRTGPDSRAAAEIANWLALLAAMRDCGLPYLGVLLHAYDGSVADEPIEIRSRVVVAPGSTREALESMAEDTLYEFRFAAAAPSLRRSA